MKGDHLVITRFLYIENIPWESDFLHKNAFLIINVICYKGNHSFLLFLS